MLERVIRFVRNLVQPVPAEEVTVVFVRVDAKDVTEWIAYVAEMPAINGFGTSAAQALAVVQHELNRYGKTARRKFTVHPGKLKYQMTQHQVQPALP